MVPLASITFSLELEIYIKILKLGGTNTSDFDIEEMGKSQSNLFSYHGVYILRKLDNVFEDR